MRRFSLSTQRFAALRESLSCLSVYLPLPPRSDTSSTGAVPRGVDSILHMIFILPFLPLCFSDFLQTLDFVFHAGGGSTTETMNGALHACDGCPTDRVTTVFPSPSNRPVDESAAAAAAEDEAAAVGSHDTR